jgi:uncharacterized protein YndB with AHSA1/START domain
MTVRKQRTLSAPVAEVWRVLADPERLPAWWPGVTRVEEVSEDAWTKVLASDRGKVVRADYSLIEREPERRLAWRHEVAASPFERILEDSRTEFDLAEQDGGTQVTLAVVHEPRGWARLAPFQLRSATTKQVEAALDGLAALVEGGGR